MPEPVDPVVPLAQLKTMHAAADNQRRLWADNANRATNAADKQAAMGNYAKYQAETSRLAVLIAKAQAPPPPPPPPPPPKKQ